MPRNGANIYSYPPGTPGAPNTTVASAPYNAYIADIEQDLNLPRPIVAGGSGASTAAGARTNIAAEVSGQVVTNYDTQVWENGSFYSAVGATGAPPAAAGQVAVHTFAGVTYALDANNRVVAARDLQDTVVPGRVYVREKKAGVWGSWTVNAQSMFDLKVNRAGDTMSGNLTISKSLPTLLLDRTDASNAGVQGMRAGSPRWQLDLGSTGPEPGANAGSDFVVHRFSDTGVYLGAMLTGSRADGLFTVGNNPTAALGIATKQYADLKLPKTAGGGDPLTGDLYMTSNQPALIMNASAGANQAYIVGQKAGATRWLITMVNNSAEGGANSGSDWQLYHYNDAGSFLGAAMTVSRATGLMTLKGNPTDPLGAATKQYAVARAGDTMTGNLVIQKSLPTLTLDRTDTSNAGLIGMRSGSIRWSIDLGETGAESSTATGGDCAWQRFSNVGGYMGVAMRIDRQNAQLTVNGVVTPTGYTGRAGTGGTLSNLFNIYWNGSNPHLYIDATDLGQIAFVSDYRVKDNVVDLTTMIDRVKALRPISYTLNDYMPPWEMDAQQQRRQRVIDEIASKASAAAVANGAGVTEAKAAFDAAAAKAEAEVGQPGPFHEAKDVREQWGFLAHELQATLIETAATGQKDAEGVIQSPNPWTVIAALTKAMQELIARVETLEAPP